MKKFAIFFTLCLLTFSATAQSLDFGVKAGLNFSNITDASNLDTRTGFVAGVFLGIKFGDKIAVQGDLLYSQQGAEFDLGNFDLDYLNVPLVLKYYLSDRFNVHLGPQFGVLLNQETTIIGETIDDIATNNFDLSGVIGIGYDLPLGLRLEGRYSFGLSDVPNDVAKGLVEGKNSVATLSVGFAFL